MPPPSADEACVYVQETDPWETAEEGGGRGGRSPVWRALRLTASECPYFARKTTGQRLVVRSEKRPYTGLLRAHRGDGVSGASVAAAICRHFSGASVAEAICFQHADGVTVEAGSLRYGCGWYKGFRRIRSGGNLPPWFGSGYLEADSLRCA